MMMHIWNGWLVFFGIGSILSSFFSKRILRSPMPGLDKDTGTFPITPQVRIIFLLVGLLLTIKGITGYP